MNELVERLNYAKDAVRWLLDNASGLVDFHDITYWAGEVQRVREEIRKAL